MSSILPLSRQFDIYSKLREAMLEVLTGLDLPYDDWGTLSRKLWYCSDMLQKYNDYIATNKGSYSDAEFEEFLRFIFDLNTFISDLHRCISRRQ